MWAAQGTSHCNETPGFPCFNCVSVSEGNGKFLFFADTQTLSVIDFSPLLITQMLLLLHLLLCFQGTLQITWVMCSNRLDHLLAHLFSLLASKLFLQFTHSAANVLTSDRHTPMSKPCKLMVISSPFPLFLHYYDKEI